MPACHIVSTLHCVFSTVWIPLYVGTLHNSPASETDRSLPTIQQNITKTTRKLVGIRLYQKSNPDWICQKERDYGMVGMAEFFTKADLGRNIIFWLLLYLARSLISYSINWRLQTSVYQPPVVNSLIYNFLETIKIDR